MKAIKFIGWAWAVEVALLVMVSVILIFALPDRVAVFLPVLPVLGILIAAQGGAAFGGPAIKRKQENGSTK